MLVYKIVRMIVSPFWVFYVISLSIHLRSHISDHIKRFSEHWPKTLGGKSNKYSHITNKRKDFIKGTENSKLKIHHLRNVLSINMNHDMSCNINQMKILMLYTPFCYNVWIQEVWWVILSEEWNLKSILQVFQISIQYQYLITLIEPKAEF